MNERTNERQPKPPSPSPLNCPSFSIPAKRLPHKPHTSSQIPKTGASHSCHSTLTAAADARVTWGDDVAPGGEGLKGVGCIWRLGGKKGWREGKEWEQVHHNEELILPGWCRS
jgi:hypothetical protein